MKNLADIDKNRGEELGGVGVGALVRYTASPHKV